MEVYLLDQSVREDPKGSFYTGRLGGERTSLLALRSRDFIHADIRPSLGTDYPAEIPPHCSFHNKLFRLRAICQSPLISLVMVAPCSEVGDVIPCATAECYNGFFDDVGARTRQVTVHAVVSRYRFHRIICEGEVY